MFKILSKMTSFLGANLPIEVKTKASQNFLSNIDEIKNKTIEKQEIIHNNYDEYLTSAIDKLTNFETREEVKDSIKILLEVLKIRQSKAEPYFLLAYASRILGNIELSIKYLHVAEQLNPNIDGIKELKESITKYILPPKKEEDNTHNDNNKQINIASSKTIMSSVQTKPLVQNKTLTNKPMSTLAKSNILSNTQTKPSTGIVSRPITSISKPLGTNQAIKQSSSFVGTKK